MLRSIRGGRYDRSDDRACHPLPGRLASTLRTGPAVRPLPMAGPAAALSVPADVVYGTGRIDASGRVTDQAVSCALGWCEGDRLTLTARPGVVTARRDPGGMVVPARACLAIPAALRRRCGLRAGDRVLLAAVPGQNARCLLVRRGGPGLPRLRHVPVCLWRTAVTTPHVTESPSQKAVVDAALLMLRQMGLSPDDLAAAPATRPAVPTFAEYVPVVSGAVTAGTRRAYGSYWNRVLEHWGERRLDEIAPSEIRQLMSYVKTHVVERRNARGGRSATEHLVAALRCLYRHAEDDGLITPGENPARKVDKPAPALYSPGRDRRPAGRDLPGRRGGRRRSRARHAAAAAAHRDRLPARRRARTAARRPRP